MVERKLWILVAPTCFKGTMSAGEVAGVIRDFLCGYLPENLVALDVCPVADGGDDTLEVLRETDAGFRVEEAVVNGPVPGQQVVARYLLHAEKKLAVLEAAQAHGYKLLPGGQLAPMSATSYGVGQLLQSVLKKAEADKLALETVAVTLGGSASTDGGLGALQALGVRFLDRDRQNIHEQIGGQTLLRIGRINWLKKWMFRGKLLIATDVVNPLLGPDGCAQVFAPQKGATPEQCLLLEQGLQQVSALMKETLGVDYTDRPGAGAAGGLAWGLSHLPRSEIVSGSQWIAAQLGLDRRMAMADLIITGEGRLDKTSLSGKATGNILKNAGEKPVLVFCGQMEAGLPLADSVQVIPLVRVGENSQRAMADPKAALLERLNEGLPAIRETLKI